MIQFLSKRAVLLLVLVMHASWGLTLTFLPFPDRWSSLTPLVTMYGQGPMTAYLLLSAACALWGLVYVYPRRIRRVVAVAWFLPQEVLLAYMALWQYVDVLTPPTSTRDILVLGYSLPIFLAHTMQLIDFYRRRGIEQAAQTARS